MGLCDKCYKCSLGYKRRYHWGTKTRPKQLWIVQFGHNPYIISLSWVLMKQKEEENEAQTVQNHILGEQFPSEQQEPRSESRHWHFSLMATLKKICFMICVALVGLQVFVTKKQKWIWGGEREKHKTSKCRPPCTHRPCSPTNSYELLWKRALNPWS